MSRILSPSSAPRRRRVRALLLTVLGALVATGCATLPVSGPVHRQAIEAPGLQPDAPYFNPPGPAKDGSPAAIVSGFLVAMQANPLTMSVAREFLSEGAQGTWKPSQETVVYEAFSVVPSTSSARVRLTDPRRLDTRGGWKGGQPGSSESLELVLVREAGQWRIANPPDALVVPTSYFERSFSRFALFFFDQTGRVLLPDPVFIPRGEQTATSLVRGLLGGPGAAIAEVTRSAFPRTTTLDLSVVVTESGTAEVPLSRDVLQLTPQELTRAVDQLAATLRQVPDIRRVRLTVGGAPVPLANGGIDAPVGQGAELDASGAASDLQLWGLRGGRVVDLESSSGSPAPGPLGETGYSMRSLAVSDVPRHVAAVSGDGTDVFLAEADAQSGSSKVVRVFSEGHDVLRPSYDMFGQLWLLDRTSRGALVYVVRGQQVRAVDVPGVTGKQVSAFSVAHDGSRLAVVLPGAPAPAVRVANVLRKANGSVSGIGQVRAVASPTGDNARLVDVGWRDPSTLALLSRSGPESSAVDYLSADGSPVARTLVTPSLFRGTATSLAVSPDRDLPLMLLSSDQRLYKLTPSGQWARSQTKVVGATYGE